MEAFLEGLLPYLDGLAGFAALVNGLLLWPMVRSIKENQQGTKETVNSHDIKLATHTIRLDNHEGRIVRLEDQ